MIKDYQTRIFNQIKIVLDKDKTCILKKSTYIKKFYNEINWLVSLPKPLKKYSPKIIDYSLDLNNLFLKYELIEGKTVHDKLIGEIIKNEKQDLKYWEKLSKQCYSFINQNKKYRPKKFDNIEWDYNLLSFYIIKTIKRLEEINKETFSFFFKRESVVINNKKYPSVPKILNYLKKIQNNITLTKQIPEIWNNILKKYEDRICITHGDFTFSNIFFNEKNIKVIDARGSFGTSLKYGDSYTDYAKIYQSVFAYYDLIISNQFTISTNKNKINFKIKHTDKMKYIQKAFKDNFFKKDEIFCLSKFIVSLFYLTMINFHSENIFHQIMFLSLGIILFSESINVWKF